jgi:hypothetical protein
LAPVEVTQGSFTYFEELVILVTSECFSGLEITHLAKSRIYGSIRAWSENGQQSLGLATGINRPNPSRMRLAIWQPNGSVVEWPVMHRRDD